MVRAVAPDGSTDLDEISPAMAAKQTLGVYAKLLALVVGAALIICAVHKTASASKPPSSSEATLATLSAEAKKAVEDAKAVLNLNSGFSKDMLIEQLSSKYGFGYSIEAATEAVEYLEKALPIDWNEQAVLRAKAYQDVMTISKDLLFEVLTSKDGSQFTKEQAEYALQKLGL